MKIVTILIWKDKLRVTDFDDLWMTNEVGGFQDGIMEQITPRLPTKKKTTSGNTEL